MQAYLDFLSHILEHGKIRQDRTGVGTLSCFGVNLRFNLQDGLPLVTTKHLHLRSIIHELLWFLSGNTNIHYLQKNRVSIWNEWADKNGDLGPVYGHQWRSWQGKKRCVDQIDWVIQELQNNPYSRRLLVNAWNVACLEEMALPPCHVLFQFYVDEGCLSCLLYMRSIDAFLGAPFNIASYALLTHMIAQQTNLDVGELILTGGDAHIYLNHREQVTEQLTRTPYPLPKLSFKHCPASIDDYQFEDFCIKNYQYHPKIIAPIAV